MGKSLGNAVWDSWKELAMRPENYVLLAASAVVATAYAAMAKATSHIKPSITIYGDVFRFIQSGASMEVINFILGCTLSTTGLGLIAAAIIKRKYHIHRYINLGANFVRDLLIGTLGFVVCLAIINWQANNVANYCWLFILYTVNLFVFFPMCRLPLDIDIDKWWKKAGFVVEGLVLFSFTPTVVSLYIKLQDWPSLWSKHQW